MLPRILTGEDNDWHTGIVIPDNFDSFYATELIFIRFTNNTVSMYISNDDIKSIADVESLLDR